MLISHAAALKDAAYLFGGNSKQSIRVTKRLKAYAFRRFFSFLPPVRSALKDAAYLFGGNRQGLRILAFPVLLNTAAQLLMDSLYYFQTAERWGNQADLLSEGHRIPGYGGQQLPDPAGP